jgi:hypothetical protein
VKKKFFNLPLNMTQQTRANISEIHLWCVDNANGKWKHLAKCPPTQTGFDFDSRGEGEFCFTLTMVDLFKRPVPERPEQSEYKMVVVVDMTPPMVDAQFLSVTKDGCYVIQAEVRDAHPDPRKTVVEYQMLNKDWRAIELFEPESNRYLIPKQAALTGMVRVTAADLAENVASKEIELPLLKAAANETRAALSGEEPKAGYIVLTPQMAVAPVQTSEPNSNSPQPMPINPPSTSGVTVAPRVVSGSSACPSKTDAVRPCLSVSVENVSDRVSSPNGSAIQPRETKPSLINLTPPNRIDVQPAATPIHDNNDSIMQRINPTSQSENSQEVRTTSFDNPASKSSVTTVSASNPAPVTTSSVPKRLINQRQVKLDYRLEQVGASGVGKVEIWITADQGQSWQKLCEDPERKSPVTVELPGEGVYGVTIVASNGRGFGGSPPNPGDAPDTWVEVDMTRPAVEIKDIRCGGSDDPGTVHVTWSARDRNMAADGVDLYYATHRDGNWFPIAKGLRNDCHYRWVPPTNVGSHVFVRVAAHDQAGNITVVETSQPFAVDDMSRPRGRLVGIVPVAGEVPVEPIDR